MSDSNVKHFVRINGKILGPFGRDQLSSLKSRGRLHSDHEVSVDRRTWLPASTLADLFAPPGDRNQSAAPSFSSPHESDSKSVEWFYVIGDKQEGPVPFKELKKLAAQGVLTHRDLIWHSGLEEWISAGEQPGLIPTRNRFSRHVGGTETIDGQANTRSQTWLWSLALDALREHLSANQLQRFVTSLSSLGGLSLTFTMIFGVVYYTTVAIRLNAVPMVFLGLSMVLVVSAVKYIGLHSLQASDALIRTTPNQMSSQAPVNMASVILLTSGILISSWLVYRGIHVSSFGEKTGLFVAAGEIFFVLSMSACFLLQSTWMNVEVIPTSRAGLEGIAVLSFLLKLATRLSALVFVTSSILSAVGFGVSSLVAIFSSNFVESFEELNQLSQFSILHLIIAGLFPLVAYLWFVLGGLFLDVCQNLIHADGRTLSPLRTTEETQNGYSSANG